MPACLSRDEQNFVLVYISRRICDVEMQSFLRQIVDEFDNGYNWALAEYVVRPFAFWSGMSVEDYLKELDDEPMTKFLQSVAKLIRDSAQEESDEDDEVQECENANQAADEDPVACL